MTSTGLIVIGTVFGGLTANPAIIRSISGADLALRTFSETKDYKKKIEMSKFCYTTYNKVLVELRTSLRGATFNKNDFLKEMTVLDETVVDFAPLVTRCEKQYANLVPRASRSMSKIYFRLGAFPLLPVSILRNQSIGIGLDEIINSVPPICIIS